MDATRDNLAEMTVPEGQYFVLGDNRDNSLDSRYFGLVPQASVVGRMRSGMPRVGTGRFSA